MTDKEQTFKILGWALAVSISISGYLLKQTIDKIDVMYTTMNTIDKRMSILEERQKMIIDANLEKQSSDRRDNEVTQVIYPTILKPDEIRIIEESRI